MKLTEYVELTRATLQYWLSCHFTYEGWLKEWFETEDYFLTEYCAETLQWKVVAKGDYRWLDYDIRTLAYPHAAQRIDFVRCTECGQWDEFTSGCDCKADTEPMPVDEVIEQMMDIGMEDCIIDDDIKAGLVVVFEDYLRQVKPFVTPIREEIERLLPELDNPSLEVIAWANHIMHVGGLILNDYGSNVGLDSDVVQRVSEMGLSYFEDVE